MKDHINPENRDEVQELYTERASFYDRFFINFLGWGRELEAFFRKNNCLTPISKVLDAGCGTGIVTKTLYKLAKEMKPEPDSEAVLKTFTRVLRPGTLVFVLSARENVLPP